MNTGCRIKSDMTETACFVAVSIIGGGFKKINESCHREAHEEKTFIANRCLIFVLFKCFMVLRQMVISVISPQTCPALIDATVLGKKGAAPMTIVWTGVVRCCIRSNHPAYHQRGLSAMKSMAAWYLGWSSSSWVLRMPQRPVVPWAADEAEEGEHATLHVVAPLVEIPGIQISHAGVIVGQVVYHLYRVADLPSAGSNTGPPHPGRCPARMLRPGSRPSGTARNFRSTPRWSIPRIPAARQSSWSRTMAAKCST